MICRLDIVLELWKFIAMVVVSGDSMVVRWWAKLENFSEHINTERDFLLVYRESEWIPMNRNCSLNYCYKCRTSASDQNASKKDEVQEHLAPFEM
ncbi:hypothetical protein Tco_0852583 [Tanacetum coccineum]